MGTLYYGNPSFEFAFDDRTLAHLQAVIVAKLRRRESFTLSWAVGPEQGSGRGSIWLDPSSILYFQYSGSRHPALSRAWIEELTKSANRPGGLVLTAEPAQER